MKNKFIREKQKKLILNATPDTWFGLAVKLGAIAPLSFEPRYPLFFTLLMDELAVPSCICPHPVLLSNSNILPILSSHFAPHSDINHPLQQSVPLQQQQQQQPWEQNQRLQLKRQLKRH